MFREVFGKLVNSRCVNHFYKYGLSSDFQYGFRFSQVTAEILTIAFDKAARISAKYRAAQAIALDIFKVFDRAWYAFVPHKLTALISSFLSNRRLSVVLDWKSLQEYPVNGGFHEGFILVLHSSYYALMISLIMWSVLLLSMLMLPLVQS